MNINISYFKTPFAVAAVAAIALASATPAVAKDMVTLTSTITYYDDGNHSRKECERLAAEQARIDALAKKFGTVVTQDILQSDRVRGDVETNDFLALSATEVRGEWIGDVMSPIYKYALDSSGNYVIECTVKGNANEITNQDTDFEARILRNSPDKQAMDNHFRNGDTMYMYFKGSTDGYLAVFLEDEHHEVNQLAPYESAPGNQMKLRKNRDYILFNVDRPEEGVYGNIPPLMLTAKDNAEYNRVYVLYSPDVFSLPPMTFNGSFNALNSEDFIKWVSKIRRQDPRMGFKRMNIQIEPSTVPVAQ